MIPITRLDPRLDREDDPFENRVAISLVTERKTKMIHQRLMHDLCVIFA